MSHRLQQSALPFLNIRRHGLHQTLPYPRTTLGDNRICTPVQILCRFGQRYTHHGKRTSRSWKSSSFVVPFPFIGINLAVFSFWHAAVAQAKKRRETNPSYLYFMEPVEHMSNNYTLNMKNLREGRWYTIFTHTVSHFDLSHLSTNMIAFYLATKWAIRAGMQVPTLLALGVGSAVTSSMASLFFDQRKFNYTFSSLGASGVIWGIAMTMACREPIVRLRLPILSSRFPLGLLVMLSFMHDLSDLVSGSKESQESLTGTGSHVGGAAFGILFYFLYMKKPRGMVALIRSHRDMARPFHPPPSPPKVQTFEHLRPLLPKSSKPIKRNSGKQRR
ncbi:hypothetical protein M426DRAFT_21598 [Hypoxylon sp. CI-4A]|nr:hypothetical protein M426DRAFT_21598 [Hypoxylon sp. CI-4A]